MKLKVRTSDTATPNPGNRPMRGLGYASDVINSQLVAVPPRVAYYPVAWGPVPGQGTGPSGIPTVPPMASGAAVLGAGPGFATGQGGGGGLSDMSNYSAAKMAGSQPFNLKLSPLPWAIMFLVIGLIGLRVFHWRT